MPARFAGRIISHLAHESYRPSTVEQIADQLRVNEEDVEIFLVAVAQLSEDQKLDVCDDERLRLPAYESETSGILKVNRRGFGFVKPNQPTREGDLFIPKGEMLDAISGDRVRCRVLRRDERKNRGRGVGDQARRSVSGRVLEIEERGRTHFAGRLFQKGRNWLVEPDGRELKEPIIIRDPHVKSASAGDKVIIDIVMFPDEHGLGEGVITEVLGEAGRPDVETRAIIETYGLATDFTEEMLDEARRAASSFDEEAAGDLGDREDLTDRYIFTIDPPDARDFDDAISISWDPDREEWELGVHIADVAHFVKEDSALDREALKRGNSVYLPRLVLPMLPEVLSNGVCSLQEGVPRFTKSAFITLDNRGKVVHQRLARTIIRSAKRLTYLEAQSLIDGDQKGARRHARTEAIYDDNLMDALSHANRLAKVIRKRRLADGMLVLSLPEFELVFNDDGHVVDAVPEDDAFTHTLIEMFMVEANEAVARTFAGLDVPLLRRTHPDPSFHDVSELREYARIVGFNLPEEPDRTDIKSLLDATRDSPASRAIHFSVLRTLTKATYSPATIGHFALASGHYAHFTSPIRRYPDLTVHRVIEAFLDHTENGKKIPGGRSRIKLKRTLDSDIRVVDFGPLTELGNHCSETEVNAEHAERDLRTHLVLDFLHKNHLGDVFDAVITNVTPAGLIFTSIDRFLVDGVARAFEAVGSDGREDRWKEDGRSGRLVAQASGASIGLGDSVKVKILRVDPPSRMLDVAIVEFTDRAPMVAQERGQGRGRGRHTGPLNRKSGKGKNKGKNKGKGRGRRR